MEAYHEYHGCICEEPEGDSHWGVYYLALEYNITVPVHSNRVKKYYVKKLCRFLKEILERKVVSSYKIVK